MAIRFSEFKNKTDNLRRKLDAVKIDSSIKPSELREAFFSSDVFNVGKLVGSDGELCEILDKRSNYVVVCNSHGEVKKKFPEDVSPVNEVTVDFPQGTFKGRNIPQDIRSIVENCKDADPVAVIKCIDAFKTNNYVLFESTCIDLGIDQYQIDEASSTMQHQAIGIFADAIGIEVPKTGKTPQEKLNIILKDAKNLKLSPERKEIFAKMLELLNKLNLKTTLNEVHKDPEYKEEISIMGYEQLKKRLEAHTGIKNYGEQEPGEDIVLVNTEGNKIEKPKHTATGHSLSPSNETHRKQLVKKLTHE